MAIPGPMFYCYLSLLRVSISCSQPRLYSGDQFLLRDIL